MTLCDKKRKLIIGLLLVVVLVRIIVFAVHSSQTIHGGFEELIHTNSTEDSEDTTSVDVGKSILSRLGVERNNTCAFAYSPWRGSDHHSCRELWKKEQDGGKLLSKILFCRGVVRGQWDDMIKTMKHWNDRVDELRSKTSYVVLHGGKNKVDMERVAKCMRHIYGEERWPPTSIGEIGTGAATMLNLLCEETISLRHNRSLCHGVDPSTSAIEIAKGQFPHIVTDVSSLFATSSVPQIRNGRFDLVVSYGVAIYLTEQQFCTHIADALLHLRPGGRFQMWQLSSSYRGAVWKYSNGRTHVHPSVFNSSRGVLWPCEGLSRYVKSVSIIRGENPRPYVYRKLPAYLRPRNGLPPQDFVVITRRKANPSSRKLQSKSKQTKNNLRGEDHSYYQLELPKDRPCWNVNYLHADDYVVQIERNDAPSAGTSTAQKWCS
eukprot:PhF_6_TR30435/c1_g1_i1/m.44676